MAELTNEQLADKKEVAGKLKTAITNFFGLTSNGEATPYGIESLANSMIDSVVEKVLKANSKGLKLKYLNVFKILSGGMTIVIDMGTLAVSLDKDMRDISGATEGLHPKVDANFLKHFLKLSITNGLGIAAGLASSPASPITAIIVGSTVKNIGAKIFDTIFGSSLVTIDFTENKGKGKVLEKKFIVDASVKTALADYWDSDNGIKESIKKLNRVIIKAKGDSGGNIIYYKKDDNGIENIYTFPTNNEEHLIEFLKRFKSSNKPFIELTSYEKPKQITANYYANNGKEINKLEADFKSGDDNAKVALATLKGYVFKSDSTNEYANVNDYSEIYIDYRVAFLKELTTKANTNKTIFKDNDLTKVAKNGNYHSRYVQFGSNSSKLIINRPSHLFGSIIGSSNVNNTLHGSDHIDYVEGLDGVDTIYTYNGNDTIHAYTEKSHEDTSGGKIVAGLGADKVEGSNGADVVYGDIELNQGNGSSFNDNRDTIKTYGGNDTVYGGDDNDTIEGGTGSDTLYGGDDDDTIYAQESTNHSEKDSNTLVGGKGEDKLYGGEGDDTIYGDEKENKGNNKDTFGNNEDTIKAYGGNDTVYGGDDDDTIEGGAGSDILHGGDDDDTLYAGKKNQNIDTDDGSNIDDGTINYLDGGKGDDTLFGASGDDTLEGGEGKDDLYGGKGHDTYISADGDTIIDLDHNGKVYLDGKWLLGGKLIAGKRNKYQGDYGEIYTLDTIHDTLEVELNGESITIKNYDEEKQSLGISLGKEIEVTVGNSTVYEDVGMMRVAVSINHILDKDITFAMMSIQGSATESEDYKGFGEKDKPLGQVTIKAGQTVGYIDIPIVDDEIIEEDETFNIVALPDSSLDTDQYPLSIKYNGDDLAKVTFTNVGVGTIQDDDSDDLKDIIITIDDASIYEDEQTMTFVVRSNAVLLQDLVINVMSISGTATQGSDYEGVTTQVTIKAGTTSTTVNVHVNQDEEAEDTETFNLAPTGYSYPTPPEGTSSDLKSLTFENAGVGTILDDDGSIEITVSDATVNENGGSATFTISLSKALSAGETLSIDLSTYGLSAVGGQDYESKSGTVTFGAGETTKSFAVNITDDDTKEENETFNLAPTSYKYSGNKTISFKNAGVGTIIDDDDDGDIVADLYDATFIEGDSQNQSGTIKATLSHAVNEDVTLETVIGSILIKAGETSGSIKVYWTGNKTEEEDKKFNVNIYATNPGHPTIKIGNNSKVTIVDDDKKPDDPPKHEPEYNPFKPKMADPLVLDMNKDGKISTVGLEESETYFDLTGDGVKERTSWVKSEDAFLVYDKNEDGKIADINEVFGNASKSGFDELREIADSNYDNKIDRRDVLYNRLQLWHDYDQNGKVDDGELISLKDAGVESISLNSIGTSIEIDGAILTDASKYTDSQGNKELIVDLELKYQPKVSINHQNKPYDLDPSSLVLPSLRGYGKIANSFYTYNTNEAMKNMAKEYSGDINLIANHFDDFVATWAGFYTMAEGRGISKEQFTPGFLDVTAIKIWVLEQFSGNLVNSWRTVAHLKENTNGGYHNTNYSNQSYIDNKYNELISKYEGMFSLQSIYKDKVQGISYSADKDEFEILDEVLFKSSIIDYMNDSNTGLDYKIYLGKTLNNLQGVFLHFQDEDIISAIEDADLKETITNIFDSQSNTEIYLFESKNINANKDITVLANDNNNTINITSNNSNSTIISKKGDDKIITLNSNDTYVFKKGDGSDTIYDTNGIDKISFGESISKDDVTFSTVGTNLVISINNSDDKITIIDFIKKDNRIETIVFKNGDEINLENNSIISMFVTQENDIIELNDENNTINSLGGNDIVRSFGGDDTINAGDGNDIIESGSGNDTLKGEAGDDTLNAGSGDDTLEGGTGNDTLKGGTGNDTYLYAKGDGADTISDTSGNDTLSFAAGITKENLIAKAQGSDLIIAIKEEGIDFNSLNDTITIKNYLTSGKIENIKLSDGSLLSLDELQPVTEGDDYLTYGNNSVHVNSLGGDDTVLTGNGNNTINTAAGNDTIKTGNGNNTINAGTGDDVIISKNGNDNITAGDGNDNINAGNGNNTIDGGSGNDTIVSGSGADVIVGGTGNDTINAGAGNDTLSGNEGDDTLNAGSGNDRLEGGTGNDLLQGGLGNDTYVFNRGDGQDIVDDSYRYGYGGQLTKNAGNDTLELGVGIVATDLIVRVSGNDIIIALKVDGVAYSELTDKITLKNYLDSNSRIENIKLSDGQNINLNELLSATEGDDQLIYSDTPVNVDALAGNDRVISGNGADNITGGSGNDHISSGAGDDTLSGGADNDRLEAGSGNDVLKGGSGHDKLYGGSGNDSLEGGTGNDTLEGGLGNDTYKFKRGSGIDTIYDNYAQGNAGTDTLIFGENISKDDLLIRVQGDDLVIGLFVEGIEFKNLEDKITIKNYFNNNNRIETLKLNDGTTVSLDELQEGTEGHDTLVYDDNDNIVNALGGNDRVTTGNGNDTVDGGSGNDTINTKAGNDIVTGGEGDDIVYSGSGDDTVEGGSGDDTIYASSGDDTLKGGTGTDMLYGGAGHDVYMYAKGDGSDTINDESGTDRIIFAEGIVKENLIAQARGNDLIIAIKEDGVAFNALSDKITIKNYLTSGKIEKLELSDGSALSLDDLQKGTQNDDYLAFGNEDTTIDGLGGDDTIITGSGNDTINAGSGNDTVNSGSGVDSIVGGKGDDVINAGGGDDTLSGDEGNDILSGGTGEDTLNGGTGNDSLYGGLGNDTYVFNKGDGKDTITDMGGSDALRFGDGITKDDLSVQRNGLNLIVAISESGKTFNELTDKITITNWFTTQNNIEIFQFSDDSTWTKGDIAGLFVKESLPGVIYSKLGATMRGGSGDDTYVYNKGDFTVIIDDNYFQNNIEVQAGNDTLRLSGGINRDDVIFGTHNNDLILKINNDQSTYEELKDYVVIKDWKNNYRGIEKIIFSDGEILNITKDENFEITTFDDNWITSKYFIYGDDDDTINMGSGNDTVEGGAGNDTIYGNAGADILKGGAGDDTLIADDDGSYQDTAYADVLEGGTGNDTLRGGAGDDTYIFNRGDGQDNIYDNDRRYNSAGYYNAGNDTLKFGEGITQDDLLITQDGNNLIVALKEDGVAFADLADKVTITNWLNVNNRIENIEFSDGSKWNTSDIVSHIGTDENETISIGNGNDTINAGGGNDIISGNAGNDILLGEAGNDTIYGNSGADILKGGAGDDTLIADDDGSYQDTAYADVLEGGTGNDTLRGGAGDDTYIFNRGDGQDNIYDNDRRYNSAGYYNAGNDTLKFGEGITQDDLLITQDGNNLIVALKEDGVAFADLADKVTITNWLNVNNRIENIEFSDGTILNVSDIMSITGIDEADTINGTEFDDTIYAKDGKDIVNGNGGNDTIYGQEQDDILSGNAGNDTVEGGAGNDTIYGNAGADILKGGAGDDTLIADDDGSYQDTAYADVLEGGTGNDTLRGGAGDDTYIFNRGDGQDNIYDNDRRYNSAGYYNAGNDTLKFGEGITQDDLLITQDGNNLIVALKEDGVAFADLADKVTITNWLNVNNRIENIEFSDGSKWNTSDIVSHIGTDENETISIGNGNDTINAGGGNDIISGNAGNDILLGEAGNDTIYGNSGADILKGGAGDDTLIADDDGSYQDTAYADVLEGGTGNDTLRGGAGDDTYIFNRGDGQDNIYDNDRRYNSAGYYNAGNDTLKFGEGITQDDLLITQDGNNLIVALKEDGVAFADLADKVTITNWLNVNNRIENIEFSDGTILNVSDIMSITGIDEADTINGTEFDDTIYAKDGKDIVNGNGGNDTIYGQEQDDILSGNAGNDTVEGGAGNDTIYGNAGADILKGGAGDDTLIADDDGSYQDTAYADVLEGGTGNDTLRGGAGDDTYIFNRGDGQDNIYDNDRRYNSAGYYNAGNDTLKFGEGITQDDLLITQDGNNLIVALKEDGVAFADLADKVTITNWLNVNNRIENIEFSDGTILNVSDIMSITGIDEADTINGTEFDDTIYAKDGKDIVNGNGGNDTIYGQEQDDILSGNAGNDTVEGGAGNDTIYGNAGADILKGGAGDDTLIADDDGYYQDTAYADVLEGGTGNDTLRGGAGDDTYIFNRGDGQDNIYDNDRRYNSAGYYNAGNDTLKLGEGITADDIVLWMDGANLKVDTGNGDIVTINSQTNLNNAIEKIELSNGQYVTNIDLEKLKEDLSLYASENSITINSTEDIRANAQMMEIIKNVWRDSGDVGGEYTPPIVLDTNSNNITSIALENSNVYFDYDGDGVKEKTAWTESGDALLAMDLNGDGKINNGSELFGNFTKLSNGSTAPDGYAALAQYDTNGDNIIDSKDSAFSSLKLWKDVNSDGITQSGELTSLQLSSITAIYLYREDGSSFKQITEAGNIITNQTNFTSKDGTGIVRDVWFKTDATDTITNNETYISTEANESFSGGEGNDTYIVKLGGGKDIIDDNDLSGLGTDTLKFGNGISVNQVLVKWDMKTNGLLIGIRENSDDDTALKDLDNQILIKNWFDGKGKIEEFIFADGTTLNAEDIYNKLVVVKQNGELTARVLNDGDTLIGGRYNDVLFGSSGNELIEGNDGDDYLHGQEGDDKLIGGSDDDTLEGGKGVDILEGGSGDDYYIFGRGDGKDSILDSSGSDTIMFGANIVRQDILAKIVGDDIIFALKEKGKSFEELSDTITIKNYAQTGFEIEKVLFDDGSTYSVEGLLNQAPILVSDIENIEMQDLRTLTQSFKVTDPDGDTLNYTLKTKPTNGTLTLNANGSWSYKATGTFIGVDYAIVQISDGNGGVVEQTLNFDMKVTAPTLDNVTSKLNEDTNITDTLQVNNPVGGTLIYEIVENTDNGNFNLNTDGSYSYTPNENYNGSDEVRVKVTNEYGLSTTVTLDLTITPVNDAPELTDSSDESHILKNTRIVTGSLEATDIDGDTLKYTIATNPIHGTLSIDENGNWSYESEFGYVGDDHVVLSVNDGNGGSITKEYNFTSKGLIYEGGDLTINEQNIGNTLELGNTNMDSLSFSKSNDDLLIKVKDQGTITLSDYFTTPEQNLTTLNTSWGKININKEVITEASGSWWNWRKEARANEGEDTLLVGTNSRNKLVGSTGDDILFGYSINDNLYGGDGKDTLFGGDGYDSLYGQKGDDILFGGSSWDRLFGGEGDDQLIGGSGNDELYGNEGNDTLSGGIGYDWLQGGTGDDTYYVNSGDGHDNINDMQFNFWSFSFADGGDDTLKFGVDVQKEDISFIMNDGNLLIKYGDGDTIKIHGQSNDKQAIEKFELSDGSFITSDNIENIIQEMSAYATDKGIDMSSQDNIRNNEALMQIVTSGWQSA